MLDGWGVLHFFFYMWLTYLFPKQFVLIFVLGVAWELLESLMKDHPFYLTTCKASIDTDHGQKEKTQWWYGRWQDIVMNTAGMVLGYYLSRCSISGTCFFKV